jgi:ABC-2 type transport system ATP-binding protein
MLSIRNYSKSYSGTVILSIEDLSLVPGIYWIKGENGTGKSTLFKSIAGIIPFEGDIELNELNLKKNPVPFRRLVNYAEAEPVYPGFLTAKDLTRFVGKTKGGSLDQQERFIEAFGIDLFFEKACDTYSSGMMKKLSLSLAFLGKPEVIILDEPLITLDEQARSILINEIIDLAKTGTTFLLSSHQALDNTILPVNASFSIKHKTIQRG